MIDIKSFFKVRMSLVMTVLLLVLSTTAVSGERVHIYSEDDWNEFVTRQNSGSYSAGEEVVVYLHTDLSVTTMVGTSEHFFWGEFIGNGHTITVNYGSVSAPLTEEYAALFRYCESLYVTDLTVTGHIYTSAKYAAGIAAYCTNHKDEYYTYTGCHFENSVSNVVIHSSVNGDGTHGGFVAKAYDSPILIHFCSFSGKLLTTSGTTHCGGFVGWIDKDDRGEAPLSIANCLYAPAPIKSGETEIADGNSHTFYRDPSAQIRMEYCYYTRPLGTDQNQGTSCSGMTNDELLEALNVFSHEDLHRGWAVYAGRVVPTYSWLIDENTASDDGYSTTLQGAGTPEQPYEIGSLEDWNTFVCWTHRGAGTGICYKLTADVGVPETPVTAIATSEVQPFCATFDGDAHTLTVEINDTQNEGTAPFRHIKGAEIRNLTVKGRVFGGTHAAGLVGFSHFEPDKTNLIDNCLVNVDVVNPMGDGNRHIGGVVGHGLSSVLEIKNTVFSGKLANTGSFAGGLQGWSDDNRLIIRNCISTCSFVGSASDGFHPVAIKNIGSNVIASEDGCYYTSDPSLTDDGYIPIAGTKAAAEPSTNGLSRCVTVKDVTVYLLGDVTTIEGVDESYTFLGGPIVVVPTVRFNGEVLDAENYVVSYTKDGIVKTEIDEAGDYVLTVSGKQEKGYGGSKSTTFTVAAGVNLAKATVTMVGAPYTLDIDGGALAVACEVSCDGEVLDAEDYTVSYRKVLEGASDEDITEITEAGLYAATIEGIAEKGCFGTQTKLFRVFPSDYSKDVLDGHVFIVDIDGNYLIQDIADWDALAGYVEKGNNCSDKSFKMIDNIGTEEEPVMKPLGRQTTSSKADRQRFAGTFDGGNFTLTIAMNSTSSWFKFNRGYVAPFAYTQGATIKDLHVAGSITTQGQWAAGLVGSTGNDKNDGTCTIDHCQVSITFNGNTVASINGNHGGFIGIAEGNVTIRDSWFDGELHGSNYKYSGGFIGLNKAQATLDNCLFNPADINIENNNFEGSGLFIHNDGKAGSSFDLTDCYWVTRFGEVDNGQGQRVFVTLPDGYDADQVTAADGMTYYVITGSNDWYVLKAKLEYGEMDTVELDKDIVAGTSNEALVVPNGRTVTLDLKGHTLDRALEGARAEGYVIKVEEGGSLTIIDTSDEKSGAVTGGNNDGNGGGIYCEGTLNILGGTIKGNTATGLGGGIYLNPSADDATYNFSDCSIHRNKTTTKAGNSQGGGLYIGKGIVTLTDCSISLNNAQNAGGGMYIYAGNVTATNCLISLNYAFASANGAGVCLHSGIFTMDGGTITGNTGNKSHDVGVGVYVNDGTFNVKGNVQIKGNLYGTSKSENVFLNGESVITIAGALDEDASIGVSKGSRRNNITTISGGVVTNGLDGNAALSNFFSDAVGYYVMGQNGEACLREPIDVNLDGEYNFDDVTALVNIILGIEPTTPVADDVDINGDGQVSIADVTNLVNLLSQMENNN